MTVVELAQLGAVGVISMLVALLLLSLKQLLKKIDKLDRTIEAHNTLITTLQADLLAHKSSNAELEQKVNRHGERIFGHEKRLISLESKCH